MAPSFSERLRGLARGSLGRAGAEGGDSSLPDADPAVVGRNPPVHEDRHSLGGEGVLDDVAEAHVLEHPPAQCDGVEAVPAGQARPEGGSGAPEPFVEAGGDLRAVGPFSTSRTTVRDER